MAAEKQMSGPWGVDPLRRLFHALRETIVSRHFLKHLQNHSGIELRNVKRTYHYGSHDVVEMENGDTYWIKFSIQKRTPDSQ